jgi:hypothetical protein
MNNPWENGTEALAGTDAKSATSNPEKDLFDVPQIQSAFLLISPNTFYYSASNVLLQSEYNASDWLVTESSTVPGSVYLSSYVVNGVMPSLSALPARPDADSSTSTWSGYYGSLNSQSVSLLRLVNADTSGPGFFTDNPVTGRSSWMVGMAAKYKLVVNFPSRNVRTVKVVEQRAKQPVLYNLDSGYLGAGSLVITDSQVRTLTLPANATETTETILQPDEADANFMTQATVAKALFITPAGDPVKAPVDAGPNANTDPDNIPDGANEFTFSADTTGVLKLKLKVRLPGVVDQSAADQAKYTFDVDAIGSSVLTWDTAGGKATVSGEYLTATAIFTGLPQNNSDFGSMSVRLKFDGIEVASSGFEVFFDRDATNHPGNGAGNDRNWFYYWRQAAGAQNVNIVYDGPSPDGMRYGETVGITKWSWAQKPDKTMIKFYDLLLDGDEEYGANQGDKVPTGIDGFFSLVLHERRHVKQIADADALLGNLVAAGTPWQFGWSFSTDVNFGLNSNHYTLGNDGKPGVKGYDDDGDGTADNLIASGRGELGYLWSRINNPPEGLFETDDVALEVGGSHGIDWPSAWPAPASPAGCISPLYIEWDAINAALVHAQDQNAADDWANPGKNHDTKAYDD